VSATNVSNVTIRNNQIANAGQQGITLNNATGRVQVLNNQINTTIDPSASGIVLVNDRGVTTLTLTGNSIISAANNAVGIQLAGNAQATATISNNQLTDSAGAGIFVDLIQQSNATISIANNSLKNNAQLGILLQPDGASTSTFTIANNTITMPGSASGNGLTIAASNQATSTVTLTNNQISNSGQDGINVETTGNAILRLLVERGTIITNGTSGFGTGIFLQAFDSSTLAATIRGNKLTNNPGLSFPYDTGFIGISNNTSQVCVNLAGNSSTNGYLLDSTAGGTFALGNSGNTGTVFVIDPGTFSELSACPQTLP